LLGNKEFISTFEQKIKDRIGKVWGEKRKAEKNIKSSLRYGKI